MLSRNTAYSQYQPLSPAVSLLQKGLDMIVSSGIILTAHSSQLTAHSSRRKYSLDSFFPTFHKHNHFLSVYTYKQTAKALRSQRAIPFFPISTYVQNPKDSAGNSAPVQLIINYELLIIHSAMYRNAQQAVWFDTG